MVHAEDTPEIGKTTRALEGGIVIMRHSRLLGIRGGDSWQKVMQIERNNDVMYCSCDLEKG